MSLKVTKEWAENLVFVIIMKPHIETTSLFYELLFPLSEGSI